MFRCITELKGIAVDIDSFQPFDEKDWIEINSIVPCAFLTTSDEAEKRLSLLFGSERVIKLAKYEMLLAPSRRTHLRVLMSLDIENTELAYLSCRHSFLENANGFLCGSIWITDNVSYNQASKAPDMIRNSIEALKEALKNHMVGFFGEKVLFPSLRASGTMLPIEFEIGGEGIPMYVIGRYFGYSHYMNQLHPYSSAIYLNKREGKTYSGIYDTTFRNIFAAAVKTLKDIHDIDSICAVPVKPGRRARFDSIVGSIAQEYGLDNIGEQFACIKDYPDQKSLSKEEREINIKGAFRYSGDLTGHTVALIDDIVSTGSTVKECIRELKKHGAEEIVLIVLAINQYDTGSYWSSNNPQVSCPTCNSKMTLLINSRGEFFYNCLNCYSRNNRTTISFSDGWKQLCDNENTKFDLMIPKRRIAIRSKYIDDGLINLERIVQCPYCSFDNIIDVEDISDISNCERGMGPETLYEFDVDDIKCQNCRRIFRVYGFVSEYPQGSCEKEEIKVEGIAESEF